MKNKISRQTIRPVGSSVESSSICKIVPSLIIFALLAFDVMAYTIDGIVIGPNGLFSGATIDVYTTSGNKIASAVTDNDGEYVLAIGNPGLYEFRASAIGYYESINTIDIQDDTKMPDFIIGPYPYVTVSGYVRSTDGSPIADAFVKIKEGNVIIDKALTQSNGYYEMKVDDHTQYAITTGAYDFYTNTMSYTSDGNKQVDIVLAPTVPPSGGSSSGGGSASGSNSDDDDASTGSTSGSKDNRVWCGDLRCDLQENCRNCAKDCGRCDSSGGEVTSPPVTSAVSTPVAPSDPPKSPEETGVGVGLASSFLQDVVHGIDLKGLGIGIFLVITAVILLAFWRVVKKSI